MSQSIILVVDEEIDLDYLELRLSGIDWKIIRERKNELLEQEELYLIKEHGIYHSYISIEEIDRKEAMEEFIEFCAIELGYNPVTMLGVSLEEWLNTV